MIVCKLCIMKNGLKGSEIANLPKTEAEFIEHLKNVHGIEVKESLDTQPNSDREVKP